MLAQYIQDCPVPVKRLGGGYYLFGTKKIYAKIMNGKLVVRVGGGYMVIEEFIATYAEPELIKMQKIAERDAANESFNPSPSGGNAKRSKTFAGNRSFDGSPRNSQTAAGRRSTTKLGQGEIYLNKDDIAKIKEDKRRGTVYNDKLIK